MKKGTIVDSTIISAPSSTKNEEKKRDPDAHQVKKGNTWHFGYKAHIGVDRDSGIVHTVKATAANVHDVTMTSELMHGEEETLNGDSGYIGAEKRKDAKVRNKSGKKIRYEINRRPSQIRKLSKSGQRKAKKREHAKSSVRAKVEHVFGVVKGLLKFKKTRYRGLQKQEAKFNIMFALANLILADRPCWQLDSVRFRKKNVGASSAFRRYPDTPVLISPIVRCCHRSLQIIESISMMQNSCILLSELI